MDIQSPRYVVAYCKNFGQGLSGFRYSEVICYGYTKTYQEALKLKEYMEQQTRSGLIMTIKYENWLRKNAPAYNGEEFSKIYYR